MVNPEVLLERLNVELDASELKERIEEVNDELNALKEVNEELNADLESLKDTKEQFIDFLDWIEGVGEYEIKVEALRLLRGLK